MLDWLAAKLGFVRISAIEVELQAARTMGFAHNPAIKTRFQLTQSVGRQLEEHLELAKQIALTCHLFQAQPKYVTKMAFQDDPLMLLFNAVHGCWPDNLVRQKVLRTGDAVRPRPPILGIYALPEYHSRR